MKIIYFHQHFSTTSGATGTRSFELAKALIAQGHSVTMVCGGYVNGKSGLDEPFKFGKRRGKVEGIDVIELKLHYSNNMAFWLRVYVFLRYSILASYIALFEKSDVVFATSTPLTAAIPGVISRYVLGKKFIFEVRDLWPELPQAMGVIRNKFILKVLQFLEILSYKASHRIVGLSPGIVQGIKRCGVDSKNIALIPNGCDFDQFSKKEKGWRPKQVPRSNLMVIYAGTHGKANGLDNVLDAVSVLKNLNRKDISIVLIGNGSEKEKLKKRASFEKLDNVVFMDPIPKEELVHIFSEADVGLQVLENIPAFYYGTSPNKFFDYLAASLPVITNYPGWVADLIQEYDCGISVSPKNPQQFAEALCFYADNRKLLPQLGDRASQLGRDKFDRKDLARLFVAWLTDRGHS